MGAAGSSAWRNATWKAAARGRTLVTSSSSHSQQHVRHQHATARSGVHQATLLQTRVYHSSRLRLFRPIHAPPPECSSIYPTCFAAVLAPSTHAPDTIPPDHLTSSTPHTPLTRMTVSRTLQIVGAQYARCETAYGKSQTRRPRRLSVPLHLATSKLLRS